MPWVVLLASACSSTITSNGERPHVDPAAALAPARVEVVRETRFGIQLDDPYRWMEKPAHATELLGWLGVQQQRTERALASTGTQSELRRRLRTLLSAGDHTHSLQIRGNRRFFLRVDHDSPIGKLYVQEGNETPRLLVDPSVSDDVAPAIHSFTASDDGAHVAYTRSAAGSEVTRLHVIEVASGTALPDVIPRIWGEFPATWRPDGSGFFYTQMRETRAPDDDPFLGMSARFHVLGSDPKTDRFVLGPPVQGPMTIPEWNFPVILTAPGTPWVIALAAAARPERRFSIASIDQIHQDPIPWQMAAEFDDAVGDFAVRGNDLYVLAKGRFPNGEVLRTNARRPDLARAEVVVAAGPRILDRIAVAKDGLYISDSTDGDGGLRRLDHRGELRELSIPAGRSIAFAHSHPTMEGVWIQTEGYQAPHAYTRLLPSGQQVSTPLQDTKVADFDDVEVVKTQATSADGTRVPMTLVMRRDLARDGQRPTLLMAYGGYGQTLTPQYFPALRVWFDEGAVYSVCHVRGGGARGRAWHLAGKGANKPQGIRDLVACAEHMAELGYSTARHVGVMGGSMGGVLVGPAITTFPEAFGAAVLDVALLNPVRSAHSPAAGNQVAELDASPDSPEGLRTLLAMDAYHHVKPGVQYPPTMVVIGLSDQRVQPWMGAKFGARLIASDSRQQVLIRASENEGHGSGKTKLQRADTIADIWSFLLAHLGSGGLQDA